jgi:hypothetical protein
MFLGDLNNAYAYELERRKDETRAAAKSKSEHGTRKMRKPVLLPMVVLSILGLLLSILSVF